MNKWAPVAFILLLAAFVILTVGAAQLKSATYEEPNTISGGYYFWQTNDYRMNPVHPPFSFKWAALPLLAVQPTYPLENPDCQAFSYYRCAMAFLHQENNGDQLLFLARLMFIGLGVVVGVFVYVWAKSLYGVKAGIVALTLYVFNPLVLGSMPIALNDGPVMAFMFISTFFFLRFYKTSRISMLIAAAIALGLAQASKITALFIFPIFAVLMGKMYFDKKAVPVTWYVHKLPKKIRMPYAYLLTFVVIVVIAYAVVWTIYGFQVTTIEKGWHPNHLEVLHDTIKVLPPQLQSVVEWFVGHIPIPFVHYFDGIAEWVYMSLDSTKPAFFNGEVYHGSKVLFQPVGLLIKNPIPLLVMLTAVTFLAFKQRKLLTPDEIVILGIIGIFMVMFLFVINWNSGIHHFLPIYPFLFVFASKLATIKKWMPILSVLLVWYALIVVMAFPHYSTYTNAFVGDEPYELFADTNTDVGNDLKFLAKYQEEHNLGRIYFSSFGTTPPEFYGIDYEYMPAAFFQPWVPGFASHDEDLVNYTEDCSPRRGLVAISYANRNNVHLLNKSCYDWLDEYEPVDTIGNSILLYDTR